MFTGITITVSPVRVPSQHLPVASYHVVRGKYDTTHLVKKHVISKMESVQQISLVTNIGAEEDMGYPNKTLAVTVDLTSSNRYHHKMTVPLGSPSIGTIYSAFQDIKLFQGRTVGDDMVRFISFLNI
jgi:hypothetical protein